MRWDNPDNPLKFWLKSLALTDKKIINGSCYIESALLYPISITN